MRFLLFAFLLPSLLLAQPTRRGGALPTPKGWQELTISDGLSQGMIYDLEQDPKGFIWIATKDGLNRYDGYNFTVFTNDLYNDYSLSGNTCTALLIDRRGRLWVGTINGGLNLYDSQTRRFYHLDILDQTAKDTNRGNYEVRHIREDPMGNLWISSNKNQVFRLSLPANLQAGYPQAANFTRQVQISQMTLPGEAISSHNGRVFHYEFRPDGRAIVGTTYGQYEINWRQPKAFRPVNRVVDNPAQFDAMSDNSWGDYWFTCRRSAVYGWYRGKPKLIPFTERVGRLSKVAFTSDHRVVIASQDYLWIMSPAELMQQDSLTARNAYMAMPSDLPGLTTLFQDRTGLIWVGTNGYGLRVFNPKVKQFRWYLPNRSLSYLFQDRQGRTYVRENFKYGQANLSTNQIEPFGNEADKLSIMAQPYLMQDRKGDFWVLYDSWPKSMYELIRFSRDWKLLNRYTVPANIRLGDYVGNLIREDKAGQLWVGAANGKLLRFDPVSGLFRVFSYAHLQPQNGSVIETHALHFDPANTLWIGTQKGLIRAENPFGTPTFSIYKNDRTNRQSLSNDFVSSVADDPNQPNRYLWVSTKGGGLERLDKQTHQFRHFTETQGLPDKVVYGILADEYKHLWMSTNRGLAQFNPRTFTFHNYTKADGLQDDEFNTGSFFRSAWGELLFGGINGLTIFHPKDLLTKTGPVVPAYIIGLKVANEPVLPGEADNILSQSIETTPALTLSHNQNQITLEFGVMDYTHPTKNRYRYRLEGIDENWVEAGTNRFANYAQLPAGHYTLQMMGSVDGEAWSKPVIMQIRVRPPFYGTGWAYLLYALVLAGLVWQFVRFQSGRLLLQQQVAFEHEEAGRLAELDALKTRFFTNISHELRTPLTLILGPLTDLKQRFPAESILPLMERNGNRLLNLINQLLDLSKLDAGQLKPETEPGNMPVFLRTLAASFESLAQSRSIQFSFNQNETELWANFDRDKLEKIVTNLVANAFKFTPDGNEVRLNAHYEPGLAPNKLILTVQDTGIGMSAHELPHIFERFYQRSNDARSTDARSAEQLNRSYEGTGIGLALVNELVGVLNGTISVVSTEGIGTTFTLTLPLALVPGLCPAQPPRPHPRPLPVREGRKKDSPAPLPNGEGSGVGSGRSAGSENILLIIDDNADIRAYVRSVFEADYQIIEATDGQDGLEKATDVLPDLVICDLMMPRLDGFGFCRALKTAEATSHIPVVMLTAKATLEDRIEGFELGADEYLTKPFQANELRVRVRNLLNKQERLRQHFGKTVIAVPTTGAAPTVSREDVFLQKAGELVQKHLGNNGFGVEEFSREMNLSQSQLLRKLRAITGLTTVEFLRQYRLERAATLLASRAGNVSEIAYQVGFESLPYFTKVFQEKYGVLPSEYGA